MQNTVPLSTKLLLYHTLSHLNYCSVVWHFCSSTNAKKLEKLNHRALSFVFNDYKSSYDELLTKHKILSLYEQRIRNCLIYVYKSLHGLAPSITNLVNIRTTKTNLRGGVKLLVPKAKTTHYGLNSFTYIAAKLWNNLDINTKSLPNLEASKKKLSYTFLKQLLNSI